MTGLLTTVLLVGALALVETGPATAQGGRTQRAASTNPVTPGDFTGLGFDQCLAPSQSSMDAWWRSSPFTAVGIYISGASRGCRSQPNLTPTWVRTQLARGWRLLPITLGPQASCNPSFPRYGNDPRIDSSPGKAGLYGDARRQAISEAANAVSVASGLGIVKGSTLWYDLEAFDTGNTACRESALAFLSAWTRKLHDLGYVSGVYSSAGAGLNALDDARVNRPGTYRMPDMIWMARWDGVADTNTSYLRSDGWQPHKRVKQFQGGHNETWGGVTINIDRDFLDVGKGSVAAAEVHCGDVRVSWPDYPTVRPPSSDGTRTPSADMVRTLQCLFQEKGVFSGKVSGRWSSALSSAVGAWQTKEGLRHRGAFTRTAWMTLLADGTQTPVKRGSAGPAVRRVQRALNAAAKGSITITGVQGASGIGAVTAYQKRVGLSQTGVVDPATWSALARGRH